MHVDHLANVVRLEEVYVVDSLQSLCYGRQLQYRSLPSYTFELHPQKGFFDVSIALDVGLDGQLRLFLHLRVEVEIELTSKILWKAHEKLVLQ